MVWEGLKECFSKDDRIRILTLHSAIIHLKQGLKSVSNYFIEVK